MIIINNDIIIKNIVLWVVIMNLQKNNSLYEKISHATSNVPYSIHYTECIHGMEPALYLHWHNEMELLLLIQGDLIFHIEDKIFELHDGEAIFIPPGLIHYATTLGMIAPKFHAFVFSGDLLISPLDTDKFHTYISPVLHNNIGFLIKFTPNNIEHQKIISHLRDIFLNQNAGELYIRGTALLIWDYIYKIKIQPTLNNKSSPERAKKLTSTMEFIHNNYMQNISLEMLAETAHLSNGEFCRSFKNYTGMTPFYYLIRYRILQSCNKLKKTDNKITEIALSCGFNNISYYNRAFFKLMGMTPKQYRKTCESKSDSL